MDTTGKIKILLLVLCSWLTTLSHCAELMAYEPVQHLKASIPKSDPSGMSPWRKIVDGSRHEVKSLTMKMEKNLKEYLGRYVSLVFSKGENVLIEQLATGVEWNSSLVLPYANVLPLIGIALPILFEDYKPDIMTKPIGDVLRGVDREKPIVRGHESQSLLDIVKDLPQSTGSAAILKDPSLLHALNVRGKLALYYINAVLEGLAKEAWLDAMLSLGLDDAKFSNDGKVVTNIGDLLNYAHTVIHDLRTIDAAPLSEAYSPSGEHFLFNWWFNCPDATKCLVPSLPPDAIFNLNPAVRVYLLPSLDLILVITNGTKPGREEPSPTIANVLHTDRLIWKQIYSVLDPTTGAAKPEFEFEEEKMEEEKSKLAAIIHTTWPFLIFLFWIISSHVWVYWLFHCCWFVLIRISKRAHIPRPKTAKQE